MRKALSPPHSHHEVRGPKEVTSLQPRQQQLTEELLPLHAVLWQMAGCNTVVFTQRGCFIAFLEQHRARQKPNPWASAAPVPERTRQSEEGPQD